VLGEFIDWHIERTDLPGGGDIEAIEGGLPQMDQARSRALPNSSATSRGSTAHGRSRVRCRSLRPPPRGLGAMTQFRIWKSQSSLGERSRSGRKCDLDKGDQPMSIGRKNGAATFSQPKQAGSKNRPPGRWIYSPSWSMPASCTGDRRPNGWRRVDRLHRRDRGPIFGSNVVAWLRAKRRSRPVSLPPPRAPGPGPAEEALTAGTGSAIRQANAA